MGPARVGLILLALSACAPADRVTTYPGASSSFQDRADPVDVRIGTAPGASDLPATQAASVRTGSVSDAYTSGGPTPATAASSPTGAELATVTDILTDLQRRSFAANAEHCGYIGRDAAGRIVPTQINRGTEASCDLPAVPSDLVLLASFHTHSTYSAEYASEWPTVTDVMSDASYGIAGYISTPGGRLWYVDTDTMTVRELCGRGCLPQDPNYRPGDDGPLRPVMTIADLRRWEAG